jgi:hypothetical protein
LRDVGLSDADIADVVFAASARCFLHCGPGRPRGTAGLPDCRDVSAGSA